MVPCLGGHERPRVSLERPVQWQANGTTTSRAPYVRAVPKLTAVLDEPATVVRLLPQTCPNYRPERYWAWPGWTSSPKGGRSSRPKRPKGPTKASQANNNAVIDGVVAGYKASGIRSGVYSYGLGLDVHHGRPSHANRAHMGPGGRQGPGCYLGPLFGGELLREQAVARAVDRRRSSLQAHLPG